MKKLFTWNFHVMRAFIELKIHERFIFVSILFIQICSFKIQFLSTWETLDRNILRTIVNIGMVFSGIFIYLENITSEKFYLCGDSSMNCFLQFFCHYFSNFCFYYFKWCFPFYVNNLLCCYWYICRLAIARGKTRAIFPKCKCLIIIQIIWRKIYETQLFYNDTSGNNVMRDLHGFFSAQTIFCLRYTY